MPERSILFFLHQGILASMESGDCLKNPSRYTEEGRDEAMQTLADVLTNQRFTILGENNFKQYMTLGCGNSSFHLLVPYRYVPAKILFERYKLDTFGWSDRSL